MLKVSIQEAKWTRHTLVSLPEQFGNSGEMIKGESESKKKVKVYQLGNDQREAIKSRGRVGGGVH